MYTRSSLTNTLNIENNPVIVFNNNVFHANQLYSHDVKPFPKCKTFEDICDY